MAWLRIRWAWPAGSFRSGWGFPEVWALFEGGVAAKGSVVSWVCTVVAVTFEGVGNRKGKSFFFTLFVVLVGDDFGFWVHVGGLLNEHIG